MIALVGPYHHTYMYMYILYITCMSYTCMYMYIIYVYRSPAKLTEPEGEGEPDKEEGMDWLPGEDEGQEEGNIIKCGGGGGEGNGTATAANSAI